MSGYKKRNIALLMAVVLGSAALTIHPAQSTASEPANPLFDNSSSQFVNDHNLLERPADNIGSRELFLKMMLSILLVVVLGAAAIYVSKKLGAKITNLPGKKIRIIETAHIGPRKAVHLLRIGGQQLLIGSTSESITKLADITDKDSSRLQNISDTPNANE